MEKVKAQGGRWEGHVSTEEPGSGEQLLDLHVKWAAPPEKAEMGERPWGPSTPLLPSWGAELTLVLASGPVLQLGLLQGTP